MAHIEFDQLFSMYFKRLFYIAYSVTRDRFFAEDVVQESFIKAYKNIKTVEDSEKIGAWLCAIVTRTAIDFLRKEKRMNWIPTEQSLTDHVYGQTSIRLNTEEEVEFRLFKKDLIRIMHHLSDDYKAVLILKIEYGLKENDIASLLELKPTTVKTRLYRARNFLNFFVKI
ncbi:sigma-70 family RNA polymerase sigma factor [Bacillus sp. ISL-75]|uniref:RNA polymerase sigma factor n=1 Tax=Bacillus sp. ISL-75 TaxID=2819137 RepID=UPI001BEA7A47|nr:sigma-70 family RNA polymerase sigma factor [Bacillus sp. ISL-75]MBT2728024.1 sigma-70 family RNA polymerase sigma factor [Bacillus sp. ISL-75]